MNLQRLRAFHTVMAAGTITKAANVLGLTQPAVSRLLIALEAEVGFQLFVRKRSGLVPTPEGQQFYRQAGRILTGIEEISSITRDIREYRHGQLRLVSLPQLASTIFPLAISTFLGDHPTIKITLEVIPRRDVEHWIAGLEFDLGVTALPVDWPTIAVRPFATIPSVAVVPIHHAYANKKCLTPKDLENQAFIRLTRHNLLRQKIDTLLIEENVTPRTVVETSSPIAACELTSRGVGISIVDAFTPLTMDTRRFVVLKWVPDLSLTYGIFHPEGQKTSELAMRFVDKFTASMEQEIQRLNVEIIGTK